MNYTVRRLQRKDIAEYLALTQYTDSETDFLGSDPSDPRPSVLRILSSMKEERQVLFVAANANGLIGHLGGFWRRGKNPRLGHCMNVGLAIAKDYWGNGIGNALMDAFEQWAAEHKIVRLELEVMTHNERAVALYKKRGFEIEGIKKKSICINGEYLDEYLMAKLMD